MQIRVMGAEDLTRRLLDLLDQNQGVYPNRKGTDVRGYITVDDRTMERLLDQLEGLKAGGQLKIKEG